MAIFYNQATLNLGGSSINSNVTAGEIVAGLAMTKTAASSDYGEGDGLTYIVSIVNSGSVDTTGVTVTDDLGAFNVGETRVVPLNYIEGSLLYYVNGVLTPAPTVTGTSPLTISGITVPAGGNATLVYEARVNEFAPLEAGSVITNTATVESCEVLTDNSTVPVRENAELSISKTLYPLVVTDNGEITYTFVIQNTGNSAVNATDNLTVSDTFTPALSDITVTLNGAELAEGVGYTYDEATGEFRTQNGAIPVPGATYTRDEATGALITTPGYAILVVRGTIC